MINFFQMGTGLHSVLLPLIFSLVIMMIVSFNMIISKRLVLFFPFFVFGLGLCFSSGFIFYDFYGIARDIFYIVFFVFVVEYYFILCREGKK